MQETNQHANCDHLKWRKEIQLRYRSEGSKREILEELSISLPTCWLVSIMFTSLTSFWDPHCPARSTPSKALRGQWHCPPWKVIGIIYSCQQQHIYSHALLSMQNSVAWSSQCWKSELRCWGFLRWYSLIRYRKGKESKTKIWRHWRYFLV